MSPLTKTVSGSALRKTRTEAGLSRDQAAEVMGISARTMENWEQDRAATPISAYRLLLLWVELNAQFDKHADDETFQKVRRRVLPLFSVTG